MKLSRNVGHKNIAIVEKIMPIHKLPNGGSAIVDYSGKMLAYCKNGISTYSGNWDWIHRKLSK